MKLNKLFGLSILFLSSTLLAAKPAPVPVPSSSASPVASPPPEEKYHWQFGPKPLDLGHDVDLQLPSGYAFLGMPDADRFLRKNGSFDNQGVMGIIVSTDEKERWAVIRRLSRSRLRQG